MESPYLELLKNRINLLDVPFTERGSRLLVFREGHRLLFRLAERWMKRDRQLSAYRRRPPIIDDWVFTGDESRPLDFSLVTYPHRLDAVTSIGVFSLAYRGFQSTILGAFFGATAYALSGWASPMTEPIHGRASISWISN